MKIKRSSLAAALLPQKDPRQQGGGLTVLRYCQWLFELFAI